MASSLAPANIRLSRAVESVVGYSSHPKYPLIYDPQVSGYPDTRTASCRVLEEIIVSLRQRSRLGARRCPPCRLPGAFLRACLWSRLPRLWKS